MRPRPLLALVLLGAVAASAFPSPAAADDLPVGEQNRRAVYAGLFALSAEFHGALPGNTSSRRVPASGMSVIGAALTQAYEDAPWLDPDDAALVFGKALEASGCTKPCVPVEQSATQMLRRAESWVRDPANIPAAQRQEAFVYANAIAAVAEDLGAGASKDPLKNPLIALPAEDVGKRLAACAASNAACGTAEDKIFADILQGTSVNATPAQLNETAVIKGGKIGVELGDIELIDDGVIESHEVLEIVIKRQPVKLSNSGQLTLNADAIQPTVTPIEQVPEASVVQLQKLEEQEDVPAEQLTAAQKAAMRDWFERAITLATPDPTAPDRQLVIAEGLGWLRQLALLDGDDEQGPLWDEFRDEATRMEEAIQDAVDSTAEAAYTRCVNGEPAQVVALLEAERAGQLLGNPDESARIDECVAAVDTQEDVAKAAAAAQLGQANGATAQATASLDALAEGVSAARRESKTVVAWKAGAEQREADLKALAAFNSTLDTAAAAAGMAADLIAVHDPKLAKQVKTVAKATFTVARAATGAVAGIVQITSQLFTGNILGAALSSVTLIQDITKAAGVLNGLFTSDTATPQQTPDEILSGQITQLSEQVAALGETMDQRFDVVDKRLKTIYTDMRSGFADLNARIDEIGHKVDVIGATVERIERKLDQFERNMYQLATEGVEKDLWTAINTGVGSGIQMAPDTFNTVSSTLFTHADLVARQSASLDDTGPDAGGAVAARLAGLAGDDGPNTLERNLNYLGSLAATGAAPVGPFGSWGADTRRYRNFRDWALASKAYARMVMEQPRNASAANVSSRLDTLEDQGEALKARIGALSSDGPLFDDLLALHNARTMGLLDELGSARAAFLSTRHLDVPMLLGGPERRVPFDATALASTCDLKLSLPASVDPAVILPPQYSLVQRIGGAAGAVRLCASADWVDARNCGAGNPAPRCGHFSVSFFAQYQQPGGGAWSDVWRASWKESREELFCYYIEGDLGHLEYDCEDPRGRVIDGAWESTYKARWTPTLAPPADADATAAAALGHVRDTLDTTQRDLTAVLLAKLDGSQAGPARDAAERLTDAKALLRSYVALAFPIAGQRDEEMRLLLFGDEAVLDRSLVATELHAAPLAARCRPARDPPRLARVA